MGGASPAGPLYLLPEGFPGSMEADSHSIRCDAQMNRSVGEGLAAQVDGFKGLGLGRLKGGEKGLDAPTDHLLEFWFFRLLKLSGMPLRRPELGLVCPVVVGQCVSEYPVEPSHRAIGRIRLCGCLDHLQEGCLDEILRLSPISRLCG